MRLMNTATRQLEEYLQPPNYAVFSHTWEDQEVSFSELQDPIVIESAAGYKVRSACGVALSLGYNYVWIDTCCIDKNSSAELSEAINSMYRWYRDAGVCIVYLADLDYVVDVSIDWGAKRRDTSKDAVTSIPQVKSLVDAGIAKCKWFTRGWTLQELIAPRYVRFYSRDWSYLGPKSLLQDLLHEITGIDPFILAGGDISRVSIARRMYWASGRKTKRSEDMAYSLLGLFDVNMPTLYGEGETSAFSRLQREILKMSDDMTIFAWGGVEPAQVLPQLPSTIMDLPWEVSADLLARSPRDFASCGKSIPALVVMQEPSIAVSDHTVSTSDDSDNDSIWDSGSMASIDTGHTSLQSSASSPWRSSLQRAISLLVGNSTLRSLCLAAAEEDIGLDRLQRNLRRMLHHLGSSLKSEATVADERDASLFLRKYSHPISVGVRTFLVEATLEPMAGSDLPQQRWQQDMSDSEPVDEDEAEVENMGNLSTPAVPQSANPEFSHINNFVLSSRAYRDMIAALTAFIYPSFQSKALSLAEKVLRDPVYNTDDGGELLRRLHSLINELEYSKPTEISTDMQLALSWLDKTQNRVEELTGECWNWWPLTQPKRRIQPGYARIAWTCKCGDIRAENVPQSFATKINRLVQKFPLTQQTSPPTVERRETNPKSGPTASTGTIFFNAKHQKVSSLRVGALKTASTNNTSNNEEDSARKPRYLFLLVRSQRYRLKQLESLDLNTQGFSKELREGYYKLKGFWRSWFSMHEFSHCDFVKFEKYRPKRYAHRGLGLPSAEVKEYYYNRQDPPPPVCPEEFREIFWNGASSSILKWAVFFNEDSDCLPNDTVERIPQRYWHLEEANTGREQFWGICAMEKRSFVMVAFYVFLCLSPSIIFCFVFLFKIGNPDDLQNATIPLVISLTSLGLLFGSMIK